MVNSLELYLEEIDKKYLLTKEKEIELGKKIVEGDKNAIKKLIEANLRYVVNVAKRYRGNGLSLEDLIEDGNIGLIKAAERYDYRKSRFLSYANWWIKQAIVRAIYDKSRIIRIPTRKCEKLYQIEYSINDWYKKTGSLPKIDEISKFTNIPIKKVKLLLRIGLKVVSLESPLNKTKSPEEYIGGQTLKNYILDEKEDFTKEINFRLLRKDIDKALNSLTKTEADIIRDRYGLDGENPKSLREVGKKYNCSPETIRRIQYKALKELRLSHSYLEGYLK